MWSAYLLISVVRFLMIVCINININFVQNLKVLTAGLTWRWWADTIKVATDHTRFAQDLNWGLRVIEGYGALPAFGLLDQLQVGDTGPAESTRRGNLQRVGLLFLGSRDIYIRSFLERKKQNGSFRSWKIVDLTLLPVTPPFQWRRHRYVLWWFSLLYRIKRQRRILHSTNIQVLSTWAASTGTEV